MDRSISASSSSTRQALVRLQPIIDKARWPSQKAMQAARDRIREITSRERLLLPGEEIVPAIGVQAY